MAKTKERPTEQPRGMKSALEALKSHYGKRPLFVPSTRRYIPMRHRALGELLSGPSHPGVPTGCVIEVLGLQHSGKTTLTFALMDAIINQPSDARQQVLGPDGVEEIPAPRKVFVAAYEPVDLDYLRASVRNAVVAVQDERTGRIINADEANIYVFEPDTLEEGADVLLTLLSSGEFGLIALDSVPAMLPAEERVKRMDEATMALLARQLGKFFRKSSHLIRRYGTTVVMVNQWRDKPGVAFGDPRVAPGGKAMGYFEAIRVDVSGVHRTPWFPHGKLANIKTSKNKVTGIQKATVSYHLERGRGLSAEVELTDACMVAGCVEVANNGRVKLIYKSGGKRKEASFATRADWLAKLRSTPSLFDQLWTLCESRSVGPVVVGGDSVPASSSGWGED